MGNNRLLKRNMKPLTKVTRCSCTRFVVGPKARMRWTDLQGQDELTRPSWNVQFDKERDGREVRFNEKLTRHQPSQM
jgi:hypothetical protein